MYRLTCRQLFKLAFVFVLLLSGCRQSESAANPATESPATPTAKPIPASPLTRAFPGEGSIEGWAPDDELEVYDSETIFQLVNGQADAFFVYGFEQVAVRAYSDAAGDQLIVQIWQVATPADAYGLFTMGRAGSPAEIGNEGDSEPGRRLSFWQDHYTVHIGARQRVDDALLWDFAESVSAALPQGGEPPPLVNKLPQNKLKPREFIFFHEELSIQDRVWLGGENILDLSHDTNGMIATYEVDDALIYLLLIEYPTAGQASAGVEALQSGQVDNLLIAQSQDNMLIAAFGTGDKTHAETLAAEVYKVD
jgi:hypothetical protein